MAQDTLTQHFKRTDAKENEDSNLQQSDPNKDTPNPLNCVTPGLKRRVTHQSEEEESASDGVIVSSQSTMEDDEAEDLDDTAVHLTQDELFSFTQKWTIFEDEDDEEDIPMNEPERIDFSQTPLTQPVADENDDYIAEHENHQRGPKRMRHNHEFPVSSSAVQKAPPDTNDKWHLDVDNTWKIFKVGEKFSIGVPVDTRHPEVVYTIQNFFNDPKVGKMARCHVAILAQNTFIGKGNPDFIAKAFEEKFHSKYVGLRYSQTKPLRRLQLITDTSGIGTPAVFFDSPTRKTKGPGWTNAFSFTPSFGIFDTCVLTESPNALDGFAGGGGMSHALDLAGFKVTHAIDNEPIAVATLKLNHKPEETRVFDQEMNEFIDDALKAHSKPHNPYCCRGKVQHVHLSPPCQGFSRMNTTGSDANKEKNNKLSLTFPRLVIGIKSATGSFENVTGMLDDSHVNYLQKIMYELIMNYYQVRVGILDSSEYGDPQRRQRVVMFVSKKGWMLPDLPEPTHGPEPLKPLFTPKDAIGDLEKVPPREKPGILVLPSGTEVNHHVRSHDLKLEGDRDYAKTDTLVADKPANTVLCSHAIKHYQQDRACTNLEAARLQSFPDEWKFAGNPKQVQKQIGNAVPIGLASAIAKAVFSVYDVDPGFLDSPPDVAL